MPRLWLVPDTGSRLRAQPMPLAAPSAPQPRGEQGRPPAPRFRLVRPDEADDRLGSPPSHRRALCETNRFGAMLVAAAIGAWAMAAATGPALTAGAATAMTAAPDTGRNMADAASHQTPFLARHVWALPEDPGPE